MRSDDDSADVVAAYPLLTVEEAARPMRIGRSKAYALAREYLDWGRSRPRPPRPAVTTISWVLSIWS